MDTLFIWGNRMAKNILIVGNGFDLSHYLPTKYDHFMDVMSAIESNNSNTMNFDDLFSKYREDFFIAKTKEYYKTEEFILETDKLNEIKNLVEENYWYRYFSNHVKEIDTWIDFENSIEEVLKSFSDYLYVKAGNKSITYEKSCQNLNFFNFFVTTTNSKILSNGLDQEKSQKNQNKTTINSKFCFRKNLNNGLDASSFIKFLQKQLDDLIKIFDLYLSLIIAQLKPRSKFKISEESFLEPDKILSFNYTNTYQKIYGLVEDTQYLHGSHGEKQNIVLGVSDLDDDGLKALKAYGFTKYHQKLFKETNYLFLDEYITKAEESLEKYTKHQATNYPNYQIEQQREQGFLKSLSLNINFYIWGHSLDLSDKEYIKDIFSLNDDVDRNVRVVVYYFDDSAKFSLLNNLLAILGKDKVEKWMKKKWLEFKPNPKIDFKADQSVQSP